MYLHILIYPCICTPIRTPIYINLFTYTYKYMCICIYVCIHKQIDIDKYMDISINR